MQKNEKRYFTTSLIWSFISKILDAVIKFFTIPVLLKYFGVDNYGILTLAMTVNAYIQLLEMGMNVGAIKFLSQWIGESKHELVDRVGRTNVLFYLIIAVINIFVLFALYVFGRSVFNITDNQFAILQQLFCVLMFFSVFTWCNFAYAQLIIANQKIKFTQKVSTVRSIINLLLVLFTVWLKLTIYQYFFLFVLFSALLIVPNYILCRKDRLVSTFKLCFDWPNFSKVFKYSIGIFALSFFQLTAVSSRPIVLGVFYPDSAMVLSEYKIIEVVPTIIISIMGMLVGIILPKVSKNIGNNNLEANKKIAYRGTSYSTILLCSLAFPFLLNTENFIQTYVGEQFLYLAFWFKLWLCLLFVYLYNMPIAALVLATGKTKKLILSTATACVISIVINAIVCSKCGVGSAVIGYLVYVIIIILSYYFYFIGKVLSLNPMIVFKKFLLPFIIAIGVYCGMKCFSYDFSSNLYVQMIVSSMIFEIVYIGIMGGMYKFKKI